MLPSDSKFIANRRMSLLLLQLYAYNARSLIHSGKCAAITKSPAPRLRLRDRASEA